MPLNCDVAYLQLTRAYQYLFGIDQHITLLLEKVARNVLSYCRCLEQVGTISRAEIDDSVFSKYADLKQKLSMKVHACLEEAVMEQRNLLSKLKENCDGLQSHVVDVECSLIELASCETVLANSCYYGTPTRPPLFTLLQYLKDVLEVYLEICRSKCFPSWLNIQIPVFLKIEVVRSIYNEMAELKEIDVSIYKDLIDQFRRDKIDWVLAYGDVFLKMDKSVSDSIEVTIFPDYDSVEDPN